MTRVLQENLCQSRTYLNGSVFEKHTQQRILIRFFETAHSGNGMIFSLHFANLSVLHTLMITIWSHGTITCDLLLNSVLVEPNPCHLASVSVSTLHQPLIQWFVFVVQIKITMSETSSYLLCSICTNIQILIHCNILSKTTKMQVSQVSSVHINTLRVLQCSVQNE